MLRFSYRLSDQRRHAGHGDFVEDARAGLEVLLHFFREVVELRGVQQPFPGDFSAGVGAHAAADGGQGALGDSLAFVDPLVVSHAVDQGGVFFGPAGAVLADTSRFALCVVPSLAVDEEGYRIGYGRGYYDRFLAGYGGVKAGLCYSFMVHKSLPRESFDVRLDFIVTDRGVKRVEKP